MSSVELAAGVLRDIRQHCEAAYPYEGCGFLIGRSSGLDGPRRVDRVVRASNVSASDSRQRYVIAPQELLNVEQSLEATAESVLGFYHSHPDHPARPSEFDREHAWPWYAYLVQAVDRGKAGALGAFVLNEATGQFVQVEWVGNGATGSTGSEVTETVSTESSSSGRAGED